MSCQIGSQPASTLHIIFIIIYKTSAQLLSYWHVGQQFKSSTTQMWCPCGSPCGLLQEQFNTAVGYSICWGSVRAACDLYGHRPLEAIQDLLTKENQGGYKDVKIWCFCFKCYSVRRMRTLIMQGYALIPTVGISTFIWEKEVEECTVRQ